MHNMNLIHKIKETIKSVDPNATIILFGSNARGESQHDSDIDLLIIVNKGKITHEDEKKLTYPLYDIEFDSGKMISPIVYTRNDWENKHHITPFYENIKREGMVL